MALWTEFPDTFDADALNVVLDAYKGTVVDKHRAAIAAFNVGGYAAGVAFGMPHPVMGAMECGPEEVEHAFLEAKQKKGTPEMGMGPWLIILQTCLTVLQKLLA